MKETELERKVAAIIRPVIVDAGLRLVCVAARTEGSGLVLRVMAENPSTKNLGVEECARLSREISAVMDVEDPVNGAYRLEVSSPGIDRPLVEPQDFVDYKGFEARVELDMPIDGQKRFKGRLAGLEDDNIQIDTEEKGRVALPLHAVHKARLVLTDDLIKKTARKPEEATAHQA